jgi:glycosyltransferase involved in cell wall biosynthesis
MLGELTLIELGSGGHYPNYMRLFLESWRNLGTGCLRAIVTNRFLYQHKFVFEGFENVRGSPVRWVALDDSDEAALDTTRAYLHGLGPKPDGIGDNPLMLYWALVEKYGRRFPSRHILLMSLDDYLVPLSMRQQASADFSGIFFLPRYHYRSENADPSFRLRVFHAVHETLVVRLLNHPQLRVVFSLDPAVAENLKDRGTAQVVYLKDPVRLPQCRPADGERAAARSRLGVPSGRKLLLFFGEIRGRKGVWKLLDSVTILKPEETARICLAIVGRTEAPVERELTSRLEKLVADTPLTIIRRAQYVDEIELGEWFTAADVVLAPYVRHVGMSGILLLAAAHRAPVIAQDFGLMGRLTRERGLGVTANPSNPVDLANAMRRFLGDTPPPEWDEEAAYAFAQEQSHEQFGETMLRALRPFIA